MKHIVNSSTRSRLGTRGWVIIIAALLIITLVTTLRSHGAKEELPPQNDTVALTVQVATPNATEWPVTLQVSGPIAAWQEAIIGAQVAGLRLDQLLVNVGDKVQQGQVLARYNSDTLRAEQAELQALWQQAESDYQRAAKLKGSGALSRQQTENYANLAAVAKARLDAKNLQLREATIVAPSAGTISARSATLGAISGQATELFRLIVDDRIEWRGELNAEQLTQVSAGQTAELTLPDGNSAQATIRQVSPALDPQSRLATLYADIAPGSSARAGMYANGTIAMAQRPALVIPAVSVVIRDGRSYVFNVAKAGVTNDETANTTAVAQVVQQAVTTGRHRGSNIEIIAGLTADARVVTQGAGFLNDGDTVRIVSSADNAL